CHFLTGYLALLMLPAWVLVAPSLKRAGRAAAVGVVALVAVSWVLVPLVVDGRWSGNLEYYVGTFWFDSYGPGRMFAWLVQGNLLDAGRWPVVTVLAALGLLAATWRARHDVASRVLLALLLVSLLLFSGRDVVGPILNLLPGGADLPLHRYISGVQLASLGLVGVAAEAMVAAGAALVSPLLAQRQRFGMQAAGISTAAIAVLVGAALAPAYAQVATYDQTGADMILAQQAADFTDGRALDALAAEARAAGGGRVYAGTKGNWGHTFTVGSVPVYSELENLDVDAIGLWLNTESIASDVETRFNDANPRHFDVYAVAWQILPVDQPPTVPAQLVRTLGRFSLWKIPSGGYVSVVDSSGPPITADRRTIGPSTTPFLASLGPHNPVYPVMAFAGAPAAEPSLASGAPVPATGPGTVVTQTADPAAGEFRAVVDASRAATVVLHSSFDPRWHVLVDGTDLAPGMFAPALVGRTVAAGRHVVEFRYEPVAEYPLYWLLGAGALLALATRRRWLARVPLGEVSLPTMAIPRPWLGRATLSRPSARGRGVPAVLALGAATLAVFLLSAPGHLQTVDIRAEFAVAQSMVGLGDFTVNPSLPYVTVPSEPGVEGKRYSHHGLGQSVLLLPAALVGQVAGCPPDPGLCPADAQRSAEVAASLLDPVCAALTIMVFFCLARELGYALRPSLLASTALALGTAEWAYAHDTFDVLPDGLFLVTALYLLVLGSRRRRDLIFLASGLCAGFAVLIRLPTASLLPVVGLLLLVNVSRWRRPAALRASLSWGAGVAICLAVLAWFNWVRFGTPLESGYGVASDTYPFSTPLPLGLAGQLLSPGKSVLLFSPALVLAALGARAFLRSHRALGAALIGMIGVHLVFYGLYQEWAGDWAWGPRYLVPLLPLAMLFSLPAISAVDGSVRRRGLVLTVIALGGAVQLLDVLVDFQHQVQLKFDDGIPLHSYWRLADSALWRHAVALVQMLAGSGRYPSAYRYTDAALGLPTGAVPDTWWSYAWLNPDTQGVAVVGVVMLLAVLAVAGRSLRQAWRR
ncbi:MAG: hypothetical protein ACR2MY_05330, partial [Candidatus Dormibacteria bacterium]